MIFFRKILNYLKRNLDCDKIWFKYNVSFHPFERKRNIRQVVNLNQYRFVVVDYMSYVWQYKEIFIDQIYKIPRPNNKPVIIDCGANIGLATYYFAKNYKNANIHVFEADPQIFTVLDENLKRLENYSNLTLINKAAWKDDNSTIRFNSSGDDSGKIVSDSGDKTIEVPTISLANYLRQFEFINLLKIDIEGAERHVFPSIEDILYKVEHLFLEYHCWEGEEQFLSKILEILEKHHFIYSIQSIGNRKSVFEIDRSKFSQQYNIFAKNVSANK